MLGVMAPANAAYARNQAQPVAKKDKNENGGEEPERTLNQMMADNAFEEIMQAFHHPLPKILCSFGDRLHVPRCNLGKDDQTQCYNPGNHDGVRDWESERPAYFDGFLREAVM